MNRQDRDTVDHVAHRLDELKYVLEELTTDLDTRVDNMAEYFDSSPAMERLEAERDTAQELADELEDLAARVRDLSQGVDL